MHDRTASDVWAASASFGRSLGILLLLLASGSAIVSLLEFRDAEGRQRLAWLVIAIMFVALALGVGVLLRGLRTMRYRLTDESLIVEWMDSEHGVPIETILDVTYEPRLPVHLPRWEPFWPGYHVSHLRTRDGTWHSWATQEPRRRIRLTTHDGIVAISPERPVRFLAELERRRAAMGVTPDRSFNQPTIVEDDQRREAHSHPTVDHRLERESKPWSNWTAGIRSLFKDQLLADPVASVLLAAGVVVPVLMVAYLYSQFEGLPTRIPIHWDATGEVDELSAPRGLWRFPLFATTLLFVNGALATLLVGLDRQLARIVVAGTPVAQVILFIALIRAVQ